MAATKSQGKSFTVFMVGLTIAAAGIAAFASGAGKLALVVGLALFVVSLAWFFKIKPEEGKTGTVAQPLVLKLAGLALALGGWIVVLLGLHLTSAVGGRLFVTILGLAISLTGVIGVLPVAASKNAIWKA